MKADRYKNAKALSKALRDIGYKTRTIDILTALASCEMSLKKYGGYEFRFAEFSVTRIEDSRKTEVDSLQAQVDSLPGFLAGGIGHVLGDLAEMDFNAEGGVFSCAGMGAPQRRERVFILAYRDDCERSLLRPGEPEISRGNRVMAHTDSANLRQQPIANPRGSGEAKPGWPCENRNTPKACNADKGGRPRENDRGDLCAQSRLWPTPISRDWKSGQVPAETDLKNSRPLSEVALNWQTPRALENGGGYQTSRGKSMPTLAGQITQYGPQAQKATGDPSKPNSGRLNPAFVEWLMGLPIGWSDPTAEPDLRPWAIACLQLLRQRLGLNFQGGSSAVNCIE